MMKNYYQPTPKKWRKNIIFVYENLYAELPNNK